jgi:predicted PurR-regulated permease PerM
VTGGGAAKDRTRAKGAKEGDAARVPAGWSLAEVRIRPASIVALVGAIVAALVVRNMFVQAHRVIGWAFAAALVAMLLLPLVERLDRHLPRAIALVVTVLGFALIAGVLWASVRYEVIGQAERIKKEGPPAAASLETKYSWAERADLTARVDDLIAKLETPSTRAEVTEAAGTVFAYFVPGILMLFFMIYGPRMVAGALAQIPEERRPAVRRVASATVRDVRVQVAYAAVEALLFGLLIGGTAELIGLPAPVLLGLIAGLLSVLPVMGSVIGVIPAVLLALALKGVPAALVLLALALAAEVVDSVVVRPRIRGRAGDVGPALIVVVTLLAFDLYGIGGALYGFITVVFVVAFVRQLGFHRERAGTATS